MQFHISREPHICGRHATSKRTAVQGGGPVLLCVTGGLMRDLVGQGLSEQPTVPGILQRQSRELVIDVNAPVTDTHSQNIFPGEVGEKDPIISNAILILADGYNPRRLVSDQTFD